MLASYRFDKYKSEKKQRPNLLELCHEKIEAATIQALELLINATFKARNLVNEPVSFLNSLQLGEEIKN